MSDDLTIWVGLGNDGADYSQTRHNVGCQFLDFLASHFKSSFQGHKDAYIAKCGSLCLVKLKSYMNVSGDNLKHVFSYFKWTINKTLVIYDELDLPVGSAKLKFDGGTGGHNGLASVIDAFGRSDFWRLRLGIQGDLPSFEHKAHKHAFMTKYVLSPFIEAERTTVQATFEALLPHLKAMRTTPRLVMNQINQKV